MSEPKIGAITLFVRDLNSTKDFYRQVFGLPVHFEDPNSAVFKFGNTLINLLDEPAARDLIEPLPVAEAAGARYQLTIDVEDVDATFADYRSRGVNFLRGPEYRPWGVRTATFQDPAGHLWEIAAPMAR